VFSVLLLTEDGSKHAPTVLELLTRRLFRHLDDRCDTSRINFEPPDPEARSMFTGNAWMEHRRDRVRVHNYVAQKLHNDRGFVVHHVDADQTWQQYTTQTPKPQVTKLDSLLLTPVRKILHADYKKRAPDNSDAARTAEVEARMVRFFRLVPCWEIEAWLYQNTERALRLCKQRSTCRCEELLAQWRADRRLLDEQDNPSDQLCLGKDHNKELAQGLPVAEVYAASKPWTRCSAATPSCTRSSAPIKNTGQPPWPATRPRTACRGPGVRAS